MAGARADARTKTRTHGRKRGRTDAHAAARDLTQTQANVRSMRGRFNRLDASVDDRSRTFQMYYIVGTHNVYTCTHSIMHTYRCLCCEK